MDERGGYGQFCPVAMAAEILCSRWTALIIREMLCGTTRFNDLRRGVPRMSPALLSKRLKELEKAGIIVASRERQRHRRIPPVAGRRRSARRRSWASASGASAGWNRSCR